MTLCLHTTHNKKMNPYELRFEIFKQAQTLADQEYHTQYATIAMLNESPKNSVMMDYPKYPSYEYIEKLAERINTFVSSK